MDDGRAHNKNYYSTTEPTGVRSDRGSDVAGTEHSAIASTSGAQTERLPARCSASALLGDGP